MTLVQPADRILSTTKEPRKPWPPVTTTRRLFQKLKVLDENELAARTKRYLTDSEVEAVMARRDKIVAYFQKLVAEKEEEAVLY